MFKFNILIDSNIIARFIINIIIDYLMNIREELSGNYKYIVVEFSNRIDSDLLKAIKERAEEDSKNVNPMSPSGEIRPEDLIYFNNIGGIIAEESVKSYLMLLIKSNNLNAEILPSPFINCQDHRDIKIRVNDKVKTIEVRSSFQYKTTLQRVFSGAFSLIGKYTTSHKGQEPDKDFYVTVIHRYENKQMMLMLQSKIEVLIVGGAHSDIFNKIGEKKFLKQENAEYLIINPINRVEDVPKLFNNILEIKQLKQQSLFF